MDTSRRLLFSSAARTSHTAIAAIVGFFMMPFLVHTLGEKWYGVWVVLSSLASNYYLLDLGIAAGVTRFVVKHVATNDAEGANVVVNTALAIYSAIAGLIVAVTVGASLMSSLLVPGADHRRLIQAVILITGLQFAAEFPFKAFAGILASHIRYDLLIYSRLLTLAISTTLTVIFIKRGGGILALALIGFGCDQLSNAIYFLIARRLFPALRLRRRFVRRAMVKELFGYSSWAFVVQIANQLRFKVDSVVVGAFLSAAAVTHYAVGLRLVEYFVELVYKATNMMMPVFTRYYFEGRREEIERKLLLLTRINVVLFLFGGGVIVVVGRDFLVRWMGPGFGDSYPVLIVLMLAMAAEVIGCYVDNLLFAMAKHKYLALINLGEAIANVALSVALARPLGLVGVAAGTAIPLLVCRLGVMPVVVSRLTGLTVRRWYANMLPAATFTLGYLACFWALSHRALEGEQGERDLSAPQAAPGENGLHLFQ